MRHGERLLLSPAFHFALMRVCVLAPVAFASSRKTTTKPLRLKPEKTRSGVSDRHPSG
jgi:hypothetical protein